MLSIILRYILPVLLVISLVIAALTAIYNKGEKSGRLAAEADQHRLELKRQAAIRHVAEQVEKNDHENRKLVLRIQDEQAKNTFSINAFSTELNKRGLFIPSPKPATNKCLRGENDDTGIDGGGTDRERLPEAIEHFLIARFRAADQVVQQYDSCRMALKKFTNQVE